MTHGVCVTIHGTVYDITEFLERGHPGGMDLPRTFNGEDITGLFMSTHSKRTQLIVDKIPLIKKLEEKPITEEFQSKFFDTLFDRVHQYLRDHKTSQYWSYIDMFSKLLLIVVTTWWGMVYGSMIWTFINALVSISWQFNFGHMNEHGGCPKQFRFLISCMTDMLGGMQSIAWRHQHNKRHHIHTNNSLEDPDIQNVPWFRLSESQPWYPWHTWQWFYGHIAMCFIPALKMDLKYAWLSLSLPNVRIIERIRWFVCKLMGWTIFVIVPVAFHGWKIGFLLSYIRFVVSSSIYTHVISPNHITLPCISNANGSNYFENQVRSSATYAPGCKWTNFFTGGLNHQVEHHLFPMLPMYDLPGIQPIVQKTIEEFNLPYNSYNNIFHAISAYHQLLVRLGNEPKKE